MHKIFSVLSLTVAALLSGCASVPMAPTDIDEKRKQFVAPGADKAGLYVYRNSSIGQALKKAVYLDGELLGKTANKVYFYQQITPGEHQLSTESEFGDNAISFVAEGGKNYFAEQFIKMGVMSGRADIKMVSEEEGKQEVLKCNLAH